MAHLHVSEVLAYASLHGLSAAIAFIDLVSAFASMRRAIAVPDTAPDVHWHAHLEACGFTAPEISAIMALACDALTWAAAGADEHTIAMLVEAHQGTWVFHRGALVNLHLHGGCLGRKASCRLSILCSSWHVHVTLADGAGSCGTHLLGCRRHGGMSGLLGTNVYRLTLDLQGSSLHG